MQGFNFTTYVMTTDFKTYSYPRSVGAVVFSDFDQTYLPFADDEKYRSGIAELEHFIEAYGERLGLVMGLVTGSSLRSVLGKARGHMRFLPHFIAPCLGSELYWVRDGQIVASPEWAGRIALSGFCRDDIEKVVGALGGQGILLERQHDDYQGNFVGCYYLHDRGSAMAEIVAVEQAARRHHMKALISRCNPDAGDPEDCFDLNLLPLCCGKGAVVDFMTAHTGVSHRNTWAFGDSCNDMEMLSAAANSFLVANADPEALKAFGRSSEGEYCHGILEKLRELA